MQIKCIKYPPSTMYISTFLPDYIQSDRLQINIVAYMAVYSNDYQEFLDSYTKCIQLFSNNVILTKYRPAIVLYRHLIRRLFSFRIRDYWLLFYALRVSKPVV